MTTFTTIIALMPVIYSTGRGADVAKAMASPVIGGMAVEILTLFVVPVLYSAYMEMRWNLGVRPPVSGTAQPPSIPSQTQGSVDLTGFSNILALR